jgi:dolichyl-phosphate-mannose-protein mannosyltransferase
MLFGDNAYGWRMKNIILGSLTVIAVFLLARKVFPDPRIGLLAALFLAIEPVHVMFSSTIFEEISATFFFVLAVYFFIRHAKHEIASPVLSGVFLGLAFAQKWYYLFAVFAFLAFALMRKHQEGRLRLSAIAHVFAIFAVLPLCIYLLTYYPWIRNGYDLAELAGMHADAYRIQQAIDSNEFISPVFRASPSDPAKWFVNPLIYGSTASPGGPVARVAVLMNNPPVWLLALPAALLMAYRAAKDRDLHSFFLLLISGALYAQFIFIRRPMFLYSAIVILPFVYIMVASLLVTLLDACGQERPWPYPLMLGAVAAWGLYLYPLATEKAVPLFLYRPFLSLGKAFF